MLGLLGCDRRLAQHVVGVAEALFLEAAAVGQSLPDRLARNELLAHQAHRDIDAAADQRLAASRDQPGERGREADLAAGRR